MLLILYILENKFILIENQILQEYEAAELYC